MIQKGMEVIRRHWVVVLILLTITGFLLNLLIFYPGYMSGDTIRHLNQAMGAGPLNDLQPPIQPLLWKFLIFLTGKISSMLLLQLNLFWLALLLLAIYLVRRTNNRKISVLPLAVGFLPIVINISGVIWSDNQLAFCLLLAVVLMLWLPNTLAKRRKYILIASIFLLLLYAGLVRNNSIIAIIPLAFVFIERTGFVAKRKQQIILSIGLLLFIGLMGPFIEIASGAKHITSTAGPMMDDVVHVASYSDIEKLPIASPLKDSLKMLKQCSTERRIIVDSFPCASEQDKTNVLVLYPADVETAWRWTVTHRPAHYLLHKLKVFVYVLFPPEGRGYIWHEMVDPNLFGQTVKFTELGEINRMYVYNFGFKHFRYLYEPWFWLLTNLLIVFYFSRRLVNNKGIVTALGLSGAFYIFSFIPTGVAADYRYIYWPVLAGITAMVLIIADKKIIPVRTKTSRKVKK